MIQMIKKLGRTDSDHDDHHGRDHIDHHELVMMTIILIMTIVGMTNLMVELVLDLSPLVLYNPSTLRYKPNAKYSK